MKDFSIEADALRGIFEQLEKIVKLKQLEIELLEALAGEKTPLEDGKYGKEARDIVEGKR